MKRCVSVFIGDGLLYVQRLFDTTESEEQQQAFRREVSMLKTLRHPVRSTSRPSLPVFSLLFRAAQRGSGLTPREQLLLHGCQPSRDEF